MKNDLFTENELLDLLYKEEPHLRQYLSHYGIAAEDLDEVMQDVLLTAWRKAGTLREPTSLRPWINKIAQRKAYRYHKHRKLYWEKNYPLSHYEEDLAENGRPLAEGLTHQDPESFAQSEVYEIVMSLGSPASNIIILHYVYKEQFNEIAATLNINENTVRSIASRSRKKLRETMEERGITPHGSHGTHGADKGK